MRRFVWISTVGLNIIVVVNLSVHHIGAWWMVACLYYGFLMFMIGLVGGMSGKPSGRVPRRLRDWLERS